MSNINELKLELEDATTLRMISSAFMETAASRVQKIKKEFETNGQFYQDISHVFNLVTYNGTRVKRVAKTGVKGVNSLYIAVTSNQRFYGNLNINIMSDFIGAVKDTQTDILVIGSTGIDNIKSIGFAKRFETLTWKKEMPTIEETRAFTERIYPYETVVMYYPKFLSLVNQKVGSLDISKFAKVDEKLSPEELNILFEPELSMITEFFERQVRALLFIRVMLEVDLARTAARLVSMSGAEERSSATMKVKHGQIRKIQSSITNAKLLETFAAISGIQKGSEGGM